MRINLRHVRTLVAIFAATYANSGAFAAERSDAFRGATSCSTSGCHGNPQPKAGIRQDEFGVWLKDPHSQAYNVLFNERSQRILDALNGTSDSSGPSERATAIWKNCLACHNTTDDLADDRSLAAMLPEGVGCEACHGSADGDWYSEHSRNEKAFAALPRAEKVAKGLNVLDAAASRAETCVKCHVAGKGIVDHDLIAAGHPALKFEFRSYLAAMPHHWRDEQNSPDRAINEWLAGQVAVATAAIDRVHGESTAAESSGRKTRPVDLAEHDCDSCHHGLSGRLEPGAIVPKERTLPEWGTWNLGLLEPLAADTTIGDANLVRAITDLKFAADNGYRTSTADMKTKSELARVQLQQWSGKLIGNSGEPVKAAIIQASQPSDGATFTWDRTAHHYYSLIPVAKDRSPRELEIIREALRYPTHMAQRDSKTHRDQVLQSIRDAAAAR